MNKNQNDKTYAAVALINLACQKARSLLDFSLQKTYYRVVAVDEQKLRLDVLKNVFRGTVFEKLDDDRLEALA